MSYSLFLLFLMLNFIYIKFLISSSCYESNNLKSMKNKLPSFKTIAISLGFLYGMFVLFIIGLLYATGHKIVFFSSSNSEILFSTSTLTISAILLLIYIKYPHPILRILNILFISISGLIIIYILYILLSTSTEISPIIVPLFFLLFILLLNGLVLRHLFRIISSKQT